MPRLDHLGIACKELIVHSASVLEKLPSFDLHCSEASNSTMERLTACQGLRVLYYIIERRYIKVSRAGPVEIKEVFGFQPGPYLAESDTDLNLSHNSFSECLQIAYYHNWV